MLIPVVDPRDNKNSTHLIHNNLALYRWEELILFLRLLLLVWVNKITSNSFFIVALGRTNVQPNNVVDMNNWWSYVNSSYRTLFRINQISQKCSP